MRPRLPVRQTASSTRMVKSQYVDSAHGASDTHVMPGTSRKASVVLRGDASLGRDELVQLLQLRAAHRRLDIGQAVVEADLGWTYSSGSSFAWVVRYFAPVGPVVALSVR